MMRLSRAAVIALGVIAAAGPVCHSNNVVAERVCLDRGREPGCLQPADPYVFRFVGAALLGGLVADLVFRGARRVSRRRDGAPRGVTERPTTGAAASRSPVQTLGAGRAVVVSVLVAAAILWLVLFFPFRL